MYHRLHGHSLHVHTCTYTVHSLPATGGKGDEKNRVRVFQHQQLEWESQVARSVWQGVSCWAGPESLHFPNPAQLVCRAVIH